MSFPEAKEFINEELVPIHEPASSDTRSRRECSPVSSKSKYRVIKDYESDEAFIQRLKESRILWDLEDESWRECATCSLCASTGWRATEILERLTHDVVNLVAYYHDCEDKSKEYDCRYCDVEEEESERYSCQSDRKERTPIKTYLKRNQRDYIKHLGEEHENQLNNFLRFKQDVIPLCELGFWGFRNCDLSDVLRHMSLNKGMKFLHSEEEPSPPMPLLGAKMWQSMIETEHDDYEDYIYENQWDSFNEY